MHAAMNTAPSFTESVVNFAGKDSPQKSRLCFLCLLLISVVVVVLLVRTGATVVLLHCHDIPLFLDGGWRILQGQVPHLDFYTPLGPVTLLAVAGGMWFAGPVVSAIAYANAAVFTLISIWAWLIARSRLSSVLSLLFALFAGLMIAGTSEYGHDLSQLTYAGLYNRYGASFTALLFIECFAGSKGSSSPRLFLEGLSSGVIIALLFFLKLNFFIAAALTVMAGAILIPQNRTRWLGLCVGVLVVFVILLSYLRFDIPALYRDMALALRARSGMLFSQIMVLPLHALVFDSVFLIVTLWVAAPLPPDCFRSFASPKLAQGLFVLFLILIQGFLSLTNNQPKIPSLFPAAALLILSRALSTRISDLARLPATLLLSLFFVASSIAPNIESVVYSAHLHRTVVPHIPAGQHFSAYPLNDLFSSEQHYVEVTNDGCDLLRRQTQDSERILALDFSNPFSYALQRPSPKGDALWWHADVTFSRDAHPSATTVFHDVALVMIPKSTETTRDALMNIYGTFLKTNYARIAESQHWILCRRYKEPANK